MLMSGRKFSADPRIFSNDYSWYIPKASHIPHILFHYAKAKRHEEIRPFCATWAEIVRDCNRPWESKRVAAAFYGFKHFNLSDPDNLDVLKLAMACTGKAVQCHEVFAERELCQLVTGLLNTEFKGVGSHDMSFIDDNNTATTDVNDFMAQFEPPMNPEPTIDIHAKDLSANDIDRCLLYMFKMMAVKVFRAEKLNGRAFGDCLYALKNVSADHLHIKYYLTVLAHKFNMESRADFSFDQRSVGNAVFGLRFMECKHVEVRALLSVLTQKIQDHCPMTADNMFDDQTIANAVYGLQSIDCEYKETKNLINALANRIAASTAVLTGQGVGTTIYGCRNLNSEYRQVRKLVAALTTKVRGCTEILSVQNIANAIYGMRSLQAEHDEVVELLEAIAEKCNARTAYLESFTSRGKSRPQRFPVTGQAIGTALFGLQNKSTDHKCVRDLLTAFLDAMTASTNAEHQDYIEFSEQHISNSLYGMQLMSSNHAEVRRLVSFLTHHISINLAAQTTVVLTGQGIANSLFGLKNLSSKHAEVRALVSLLSKLIFKTSEFVMQSRHSGSSKDNRKAAVQAQLSGAGIGMAIFGLRNMSCKHQEVLALLKVLTWHISDNSASVFNGSDIHLIFSALRNFSSESAEVRQLLSVITKKINNSFEATFVHGVHLSRSLLGLQNLHSGTPEVAALVGTLPRLIVFSPQAKFKKVRDICECLCGLRYMRCDVPEVAALVVALKERIVESVITNEGHYQDFGNLTDAEVKALTRAAVYGEMDEDETKEEVTEVMEPQPRGLLTVNQNLRSIELDNLVYVLQALGCDVAT